MSRNLRALSCSSRLALATLTPLRLLTGEAAAEMGDRSAMGCARMTEKFQYMYCQAESLEKQQLVVLPEHIPLERHTA